MKRMEERIPAYRVKEIRETSACCISGERGMISKKIQDTYDTVEERFEALSNEKLIVGGDTWKDSHGVYYVSFWHSKIKNELVFEKSLCYNQFSSF